MPATYRRCVAVALLLLAGCPDSGPPKASVSGTVRLDGQLIETGSINFFPVADNTGPSAGARIENGKYHIAKNKGVVVGKNRVELRGNRKTGRMVRDPLNDDLMVPEVVEAFPPQYNRRSTLIRDIEHGSNSINFDLKSVPGPDSVPPE